MSNLWGHVEEKLNKSGRKWEESKEKMPYRCAELFCESCGQSLGIYDIVDTNLQSNMYCKDCLQKYIKATPVKLDCGTILMDMGNQVQLNYTDNYYESIVVIKTCYFNKRGRYIKVKGKRYYV